MDKKIIIVTIASFILCFCSSLAKAQVTLSVGNGACLPGNVDCPVSVSLENLDDAVSSIQVDVCDVDDKLTCTDCSIAGRIPSEFSCFAAEQPDGCCRIVLTDLSLTGAIIDTGTGPVFTVNYEVDMSAPTGGCRLIDPQQVSVGSVDNTALNVDLTPGDFCFTSPPPDPSSIPTLSEWGLIIFMTLILGISVVMLYRRREI